MADPTRSISDDLRAAYDGLPHPAVVLGRDGGVRYLNPRARELARPSRGWALDDGGAGLAWEEMLGRPDPAFAEALEAVVAGRATRIELPRLTTGGAQYRVRIWRSGDGLVHGFFLPLEGDETEEGRRSAAAATLLDVLPDFPHGRAYVFDERLHYLAAWGREATRGTEAGDDGEGRVVGASLEEAWPDELVAQLAAPYLRALAGRASDFVAHRGDRLERHWTAGIAGRDGRGGRGVDVVWDVTERLSTEASLGLVRNAVEALPLGMTVGGSGRGAPIAFANRGFAELSGLDLDDIVGRDLAFIFADDADEVARGRLEAAIRDGTSAQEVLLARRADGSTFWDRVTLSPIGSGEGGSARLVALHEDVSTHRRAGEELAMRRRMGALGELAGGIAHEIRNVLTGSGLAIELLVEQHQLPEAVLVELRTIHERLAQGESVTDRLLAFARSHTFERGPLDLRRFVESRLDALRARLPESIEVAFDAPDEPAWIVGNDGQLDQVLANLVANAEEAMAEEGGRLEITVRSSVPPEALEAEGAIAGRDAPDAWVLVRIRDEGAGMSEEVRRRAFEPFFSSRKGSGHSGLGLASVYGVVRELGGACWIESREGAGTIVSLAFPEIADRPRTSSREAEAAPPVDRRFDGLRVLLAEDDRAIRRACSRFLVARGATVEVVADGAAGLECLGGAGEGRFDLLIADAVMPSVPGPDLILEARRRDPGIACLLMSGHTWVDLPPEMADVRFLEKPFSMSELAGAIEEALGFGAPEVS